MTDDYDIGAAFAAIEDELIASMMRNMERHKIEEIKEDKQWSMWQAEQLKALEKYKRDNLKKYGKQFEMINKQIDTAIRKAKQAGGMKQEIQILQAIKKGFKVHGTNKSPAHQNMTAEFFKLNEEKLEALIEATTHDMEKAEVAILRRANDQYRKVIYNAQVYANTGAGTYAQAVDMATKDFLAVGIQCIQYANGSMHSISDYADMALKTASKRAYLQGEGEKRQEWGISTVIMNKRGNPCPKCLPFCGKVFIDDVWSDGSKNGKSPVTGIKYPLMSEAIAKGLYHPRCKDVHTTYFEGISTPPKNSPYTREELNEIAEKYSHEQKQQYAQRQATKYDRMAKYSLDEENQRVYRQRSLEWNETIDYMSNSFRPQYSTHENLELGRTSIEVQKVSNSQFDLVTDSINRRDKAVRLAEKYLRQIQKDLPEDFEMPTIAVVDFDKYKLNPNAIGGYHGESGVLYINSKYNTREKILEFVNRKPGLFANTTEYAPYLHELGHKYYEDCIKSLAQSEKIGYNQAKMQVNLRLSKYIDSLATEGKTLKDFLSGYAKEGYYRQQYTEVVAESFSARGENIVAQEILQLLKGGDIK